MHCRELHRSCIAHIILDLYISIFVLFIISRIYYGEDVDVYVEEAQYH